MQELLGRLGALDPEASLGLRVIACLDQLMSGGVAVHGLLSAAAALAGAPTGFAQNNSFSPGKPTKGKTYRANRRTRVSSRRSMR